MTASGDSMTSRRDDEQEMTMEEILASIRKYVTEDSTTPANVSEVSDPMNYIQENEEEVLDLKFAAHNTHSLTPQNVYSEIPIQAPQAYAAPHSPHQIQSPLGQENSKDQGFLSSTEATHASAQSMSRLIETAKQAKQGHAPMPKQVSNQTEQANPALQSTLEALAIQAMSPLVQKWLEGNLSQLVEKLVQKEIQRITQDLLK